MQNFMFENPTKIIFGKGSIAKIGAEVKRFGNRVLMVYGMGSVRTTGHLRAGPELPQGGRR